MLFFSSSLIAMGIRFNIRCDNRNTIKKRVYHKDMTHPLERKKPLEERHVHKEITIYR